MEKKGEHVNDVADCDSMRGPRIVRIIPADEIEDLLADLRIDIAQLFNLPPVDESAAFIDDMLNRTRIVIPRVSDCDDN